MKIITTHQNPTFDSIAGVFAASLLDPYAAVVLPKKLERVQKNFLSLHFKPGDFIYDNELDCRKVTGATLVCVKSAHRIAPISAILDNPNIFIAVIDKSPAIKCEIQADSFIENESGSVTAVICRRLFESGVEISPLYATLFALGIHEITGSLLYPNTTEADINCLAELFRRGADLKTVNLFLKEDGLSNIQKSVLDDLAKSRETVDINGFEVNFYFAESGKFVYKFDSIIQRIVDSDRFSIAVFVARMGQSVHVLARSNVERVNLGEIFARAGGGGPKYAAYATLPNCTLNEGFEKIKAVLKRNLKPAVTARDIMGPSVLFLNPDVIISEAEKIMFRYAYTAAPVTDGKKIVGFIRKIDIDRAIHHGLSHAPISGFLCRETIYSQPGEPFETVVGKIARSETKTILVGSESRVVGIITANDILNHTFARSNDKNGPASTAAISRRRVPASSAGRKTAGRPGGRSGIGPVKPPADHERREGPIKVDLSDYFSKPVFRFLREVSKKASELKVSAYIVGGIVRDMILKKQSADIDIVIEGMSAIDFLEALAPSKEFITGRHERFKTAAIAMPNLPKIDFATARAEFYESPAALPEIFQGNLYQDLLRRDFTINAMAVSLCARNFGEIIDYYGGFDDISKKVIRPLHSLSFIEDPTRIFRALRFKTRLGFSIDRHAAASIREALKFDVSKKIEPIRIFNELEHIFREPTVHETMREINKYGLFDFISADIIYTDVIDRMVKNAAKYLAMTEKSFAGGPRPDRTAIFFSILLLNESGEKARALAARMNASKRVRDIISEICELLLTTRTELENLIARSKKNGSARAPVLPDLDVYRLFRGRSNEFLITLLAAVDNRAAYDAVTRYIFKLSNITPTINGNILKNMGAKPGPAFRTIIDRVTELKAAGKLKTHIDEIACAKQLIEKLERGGQI